MDAFWVNEGPRLTQVHQQIPTPPCLLYSANHSTSPLSSEKNPESSEKFLRVADRTQRQLDPDSLRGLLPQLRRVGLRLQPMMQRSTRSIIPDITYPGLPLIYILPEPHVSSRIANIFCRCCRTHPHRHVRQNYTVLTPILINAQKNTYTEIWSPLPRGYWKSDTEDNPSHNSKGKGKTKASP